MRALLATTLVLLSACGASPPPAETPPTAEAATPTDAPRPATATEFVRMLEAIATGAQPGSLEAHVDEEFAHRLPSGDELATLFRSYPEGCTPLLEESPGYGAIAIPPPMDEPEEEAARIEAIIEELQASTEVMASCHVTEEIEGERVERDVVVWAIAVRRGEDGAFRAMAWRNIIDEDPMAH